MAQEAQTFAYVTNVGEDIVSVIDTESNIVVDTVSVGDEPRGIAITPAGSRVYVANQSDDTVSVIDTNINTVIDTVPVGAEPRGVAITPVVNALQIEVTINTHPKALNLKSKG